MAAKTKSELITQSNDTFFDNTTGLIIPTNHRAFNDDCIDSFANQEDNNSFNGINTFNAAVKVNNRLDTAYADLGGGSVMDIGAAPANFLRLGGENYTITDFGTVTQGTWRFILFTGEGILQHGTKIQCPTQTDIKFVGGDTCMVVSLGSGDWIVFNYQKFNGSSVASFNYPWAYGLSAPTASQDETQGYLTNYRWIEGNSTNKREYVLNDQTTGNWMLMGGTVGFAAGSSTPYVGDIIFTAITFSGQSGGSGVSEITHNIRYHLVSDVFTMDGWIDITFIDLNNASPTASFNIDCGNGANLNFFGPSTVTTAVGMGYARWNGAIAPHRYEIPISGDANTNKLSIGIVTGNPHFGSDGSLRIYFTLTAGVTLV